MATKEARGTKRTCQNPDCENRFYDLMRDPIVCPHCEAVYKLTPDEQADADKKTALDEAEAAVPVGVVDGDDVAGDGDEIEEDDALISLEDADEDDAAASTDDDDDAFLPDEDDDDDDVSDILGTPVTGKEDDEEI